MKITVGDFSMKHFGPIRVKKCLKWEEQQIVSDEELACYQETMRLYPEMLSDDYQTHDEVCVEYSGTETEELSLVPLSSWLTEMKPYDSPLSGIVK